MLNNSLTGCLLPNPTRPQLPQLLDHETGDTPLHPPHRCWTISSRCYCCTSPTPSHLGQLPTLLDHDKPHHIDPRDIGLSHHPATAGHLHHLSSWPTPQTARPWHTSPNPPHRCWIISSPCYCSTPPSPSHPGLTHWILTTNSHSHQLPQL